MAGQTKQSSLRALATGFSHDPQTGEVDKNIKLTITSLIPEPEKEPSAGGYSQTFHRFDKHLLAAGLSAAQLMIAWRLQLELKQDCNMVNASTSRWVKKFGITKPTAITARVRLLEVGVLVIMNGRHYMNPWFFWNGTHRECRKFRDELSETLKVHYLM